jgi:hypothetical protein
MPVYIDKANLPYRNMKMCHMIADTEEELHDMALKIGMKKSWFQKNASFPHYDVCLMRKKIALELGTIEVDRRALVYKMREIRKKNKFN